MPGSYVSFVREADAEPISSGEVVICTLGIISDGLMLDCDSCSSSTLTPPESYTNMHTYTVGGATGQYEVPTFDISPVECESGVSYSASASPAAALITESASGRGMSWYTTDTSAEGTYTITVTATAGCDGSVTELISYTLTIEDPCTVCSSSTLTPPASYTSTLTYTVGGDTG